MNPPRQLPAAMLRANDAPADVLINREGTAVGLVRNIVAARVQPLKDVALVVGQPAKMIAPANKNRLSLIIRGVTVGGEWRLGGADGTSPSAVEGIPVFGIELISLDVTDSVWAIATVNGSLAVAELVSPFSAP